MAALSICAMPGEIARAQSIASLLDAGFFEVAVRQFPDGEKLVTMPPLNAQTVAICCALNEFDKKIVQLLFAASAARGRGATGLILVAPYLGYMRQDIAFHPGEAVSQQIVADLLAHAFDKIITIEPHLHRTTDFDALFRNSRGVALSAAPLFASLIRGENDRKNIVVAGPDSESRPWVEAIAKDVGCDIAMFEKRRQGDRQVRVDMENAANLAGKRVFLVDDILSTGETLKACARELRAHGAASVEALIVHALNATIGEKSFVGQGIDRIRSIDTVFHSTNAISANEILAKAVGDRIQ
jgi:ribose-phosphate pyrophosphokinase